MFAKPKVLLFDVNETLLDLAPLKKRINNLIGNPNAASLWFATTLQYTLVMTVGGQYRPMPDIGAAVLQMIGQKFDIPVGSEEAREAVAMMRTLPPYPEVQAGLARLKQAGFRLAPLTNSSAEGLKTQMRHAGLDDCFERQLSVEAIRKYKPHMDAYRWAAETMQVKVQDCMLVAAHGWDIAGAKWAGLSAAFVARPGQQLFPLSDQPDLIVDGLTSLADKLAT